jgi:hypothetical protein
MQTVKVKVEWVDTKGFHFLVDNVVLTFPDDMGTFPMPKDKNTEKALRTQHPEIWAKIPRFDKTHLWGLCITRQRD